MATGSGYIYKTLPNELRIKSKAQIFARMKGEKFLRLLGDTTSITGTRTIEETEVYSNETPDKDLALVDMTKNDFTVNAVFRQLTAFAKKVMFQSEMEKVAQAAAVDQLEIFVGVSVGDLLPLGLVGVSNVVVKIDDATLVRGAHYSLDAEMGRVQIDAFPEGFVGTVADVDITFDAAATEVETYGITSQTDMRAEIVIRQNNKWGPSFDFLFWDMQARPDGDLTMSQDGDEFGENTVIFRAYADSTKPAAYRLGQVRQIPKLAA